MTKEVIITKLKGIVAPYVQNNAALQDFNQQTDFIKDLEINSANMVDIILDVEDEFDITIDNEAMDAMLNVDNAVAIIQEKKSTQ